MSSICGQSENRGHFFGILLRDFLWGLFPQNAPTTLFASFWNKEKKFSWFKTFIRRRISLRFQIRRVFENWLNIHVIRIFFPESPRFSQYSHINPSLSSIPRCFSRGRRLFQGFPRRKLGEKKEKKKEKSFPRTTSSSCIQICRACRDWLTIDWGRVFCPPITRHTLAS